MSLYIVRLKENHELVGIISAPTIPDLSYIVDEVTDATDCEYRSIRDGGIMWPNSGAITVPIPTEGEPEDNAPDLGKFELSEDLWCALHDFAGKWKPLPSWIGKR